MLILALDTALGACSAAVWRDGRILARDYREMSRGHSEALMPMVGETVAAAGVTFADLDRVAVTLGPGTFTGLRIGLAAARGLALATGAPLVGVTTLEAVAFAHKDAAAEHGLVVALDSARPDLFVQLFGPALAEQTPIEALAPESAAALVPAGPILVAGNGAARLRRFFDHRDDVIFEDHLGLPDAVYVAALAATKEPSPKGEYPAPIYIHPPYAKLPGPAK